MSQENHLTRNISLSQAGDKNDLNIALSSLDGVLGLGLTNDWFEITYDVTKIQWNQIELIITDNGFSLSSNMISKLKRHWYQYSDINVRDNFSHKAHCCNKPPK